MPEWLEYAFSLFIFFVGFVTGYLVRSVRDYKDK